MKLPVLLAVSAGLLINTVFSQDGSAAPANILFILADDLGWADTTLYGQTQLYETPNLEKLASRGMTFTRAYTANPLCSPTRSSILTGLHPARTGLTSPNCHTPNIVLKAKAADDAPSNKKLTAYTSVTRLDPAHVTIAERLKESGYVTGHFGKWHLGAEPYSPLEHGFDVDVPHWHGPGPAGSFVAPWKFPDFKEKYPGEHIEDRMGDEAVAFLEANKDKPFFLNYWQFSVHAPFDAKKKYIEKYRSKIDPKDEQRSPTYAAMVQSLDENVGKMLDALDRLELTDKTAIIFFSDNGGNMYNEVDGTTPTSNRPLRGGKGNNWDGGVRVPAVVSWPGVTKPGTRCDNLITSPDFYPTLLAMAGLEPDRSAPLDGISLVPAFRGETLDRDAVFTFFPHSTGVPDTLPPSASAYSDDWKLLRLLHSGKNGDHEHRLFDLQNDMGERKDLSAEYPDKVTELSTKLDRFLKDTGAVFPRPNPNYNPASAELTKLGIRAGKGMKLDAAGGNLIASVEENNAQINLQLKEPSRQGEHTLVFDLFAEKPGRIALRWAEKGKKPLYFRDRLVLSSPYKVGASTIAIPFASENSVISFRADFQQQPGTVRISNIHFNSSETTIWPSR